MMKRLILAFAASICVLLAAPALADPAPFDLAGPSLRITVTRHGATLPIGAVPQLGVGDKLRVEAKLPSDETAHYLLVVAFLREPTNPPPGKWFKKSETWRHIHHGGGPINLTIPKGAQHLVLFLAPSTGGDFRTLVRAVEARPGAFVRAAQDLEQASLDLGRYDTFLAAIRKVAAGAPDTLTHVAPVVANSLRIKINQDCLQREQEFQASCLLDAKQTTVLGNDDRSDSNTLSNAATNLALTLSATPAGGLGYFSPYISAIHEIIGIFGAMHTARYQYIPALGVARGDTMSLVLNTPPSFANPKSVLMAALPEVKATHPPVLQMSSGIPAPCFGAKQSSLTVTANPLIYSTDYAHDMTLRVQLPEGRHLDLPLLPDATRGGLVIAAPASMPTGLSGPLSATVHGMWGFDSFVGPRVTLQTAGNWQWRPSRVGNGDGPLTLTGAVAACVSSVTATSVQGETQPVKWNATGPHEISVTLPAEGDNPGPVTLAIAGPGGIAPARLTVTPPAESSPPDAQIVAHSSEPLPPDQVPPVSIILDSPDEISANSRLNFTLKASGQRHFTGHEAVEIRAADIARIVKFTLGNGLTLVDPETMVASLTPARAMGTSAFGPLRVRLVRSDAVGDWQNLGTLVRLPRLKRLVCPADHAKPCTLFGSQLYLLGSVSATRDFEKATSVPSGYPGFTLTVPHPRGGKLFVRLHDAPEVVNRIKLAKPLTPYR